MGQGFYTDIYFGALWEPPRAAFGPDDEGEGWYDMVHVAAVKGASPRLRYEAKNEWFGYMVADCGQNVSQYGKAKIPYIAYEAFDLAELPLLIAREARFAKALSAAKASYARLVRAAAKLGIDVPPGRLLLVNDYD